MLKHKGPVNVMRGVEYDEVLQQHLRIALYQLTKLALVLSAEHRLCTPQIELQVCISLQHLWSGWSTFSANFLRHSPLVVDAGAECRHHLTAAA